ncbi:MAG: hypothetical protein ACE5LX_01900 [Nitrospinota bacterium]
MARRKRLSPRKARTRPLRSRPSKVRVEDFSRIEAWGTGEGLEAILPQILKGKEIREIADEWSGAIGKKKAVILAMGAHPIKCGLSPLIIDLMQRRALSALASTGALAIHDIEVALVGATSEEVEEELPSGLFGMARETGAFYNRAVRKGVEQGLGLGEALGKAICEEKPPYLNESILARAYELGIPLTLHLAIGADVTHMHPGTEGALLGEASYRDFLLFAELLGGLDGGGLYINLGSAVQMPEVFLKALNLSRNLKGKPHGFSALDMDMTPHYRPTQNVLSRPLLGGGRAYRLVGHHEINFPLLYSMVLERLSH